MCHINILKKYLRRTKEQPAMAAHCHYEPSRLKDSQGDPLMEKDPTIRLKNSIILKDLEDKLMYLPSKEKNET